MTDFGVFVRVGNEIRAVRLVEPGASHAARLFGCAPSSTSGPERSPAHDLIALLHLASEAGATIHAVPLFLHDASELDEPDVRAWLEADTSRLALVQARTSSELARIEAHALTLERRAASTTSLGSALELCVDVPFLLRLGHWADDAEQRERAAIALFAAALDPHRPPLDWHLVEGVAARLLEYVDSDTARGWEVAFARAVARRHQGADAVLAWPDHLDTRPVDEQLTILAHVVQSASDGDLELARAYAAAAMDALDRASMTGPAEVQTAYWRLRGAIGRALAAVGDYDAAAPQLEACRAHWTACGRLEELSFPLCEALRIGGISGHAQRVESLEPSARALLDAGVAAAYVGLARGRALAQVGEAAAARPYLATVCASVDAPSHVRDAGLRWLARACAAMGASHEALAARESLEASLPLGDQAYLSRLDEALRQEDLDAARSALDGLLSCGPRAREAARTLARIREQEAETSEIRTLQRLADEYRY